MFAAMIEPSSEAKWSESLELESRKHAGISSNIKEWSLEQPVLWHKLIRIALRAQPKVPFRNVLSAEMDTAYITRDEHIDLLRILDLIGDAKDRHKRSDKHRTKWLRQDYFVDDDDILLIRIKMESKKPVPIEGAMLNGKLEDLKEGMSRKIKAWQLFNNGMLNRSTLSSGDHNDASETRHCWPREHLANDRGKIS